MVVTAEQFQDRHMSTSGSEDDWVSYGPKFAEDGLFPTFRSHPTMLRVVEGSPARAGKWNLRRLKSNKLFGLFVEKFSTSDFVGAPKNLIYFNFRGKNMSMNPTTLRYVNNLMNMLELFGPDVFRPAIVGGQKESIVEIGSGYGGECKIVNDFVSEYFKSALGDKWNVFDLNSSLPLISRWLATFGYWASMNPDQNSLGRISLVVSNAAFSEMKRELQEKYMSQIIEKAQRGYFIENFSTFSVQLGGFTRDEFIGRLKLAGKQVLDLEPRLWLSDFDQDASTGLIVFSTKKLPYIRRHLDIADAADLINKRLSGYCRALYEKTKALYK